MVFYEFPEELRGAELCWVGSIFLGPESVKVHHPDFSCVEIDSRIQQHRVYYSGIGKSIQLELRPALMGRVRDILRQTLLFFLSVGLLLVSFSWKRRQNFKEDAALLAMLTLSTVIVRLFSRFYPMTIFSGGNDGLTHEALARRIAYILSQGDVREALRGGESIFYYMPGLRYFSAIGKFIFGESHLFYFFAMLFLPIVLSRLLECWRTTSSQRLWAVAVLCLQPFSFGVSKLSFRTHLELAGWGYAEPLAVLCMPSSWLLLERSSQLLSGVFSACAVILRPNYGLGLALAGMGSLLEKFSRRELAKKIVWSSGFAAFLLLTLHNWIFGARFVPLTASNQLPTNRPISSSDYLHFMTTWSFQDEAWTRISDHFSRVLFAEPVLFPFGLAACVLIAIPRTRRMIPLTLVSALIGFGATAFFFRSHARHGLHLWTTVYLCFVFWIPALLGNREYGSRAKKVRGF